MKKKSLFWLLKILGALILLIALKKGVYLATDGFQFSKLLTLKKSIQDEKTLSGPTTAALQDLLAQPFHYMNRGAQSFVFVSEDGNYVLKFLKTSGSLFSKQRQADQEIVSLEIAYHKLQEETGLVYIHTSPLGRSFPLSLVDKLGIFHKMEGDSYVWALQQRAQLVFDYLKELMTENRLDEAKNAISQLLLLIKRSMEKGISNGDPNLRKNFGFIQGRPIQIDLGRLSYAPCANLEKFMKYQEDLQYWLTSESPELGAFFHSELERIFQ